MSSGAAGVLPRISTIDMVHQPLAEYLRRFPDVDGAEGILSPLDNYLIHLVLEFLPNEAVAFDLATRSTRGSSTVALMASPRPKRILIEDAPWPLAPEGQRSHEVLRRFADSLDLPSRHALSEAPPSDDPWEVLEDPLGGGAIPVAILSAVEVEAASGTLAAGFLDRFPGGLVIVVGVGKVSADAAAQTLVGMSAAGTGLGTWFLRDGAPTLFDSSIAVLFRGDASGASSVVKRINQLFVTNYDFLNTVRDACMYALERGARSERAWRGERGRPAGDLKEGGPLERMLIESSIDEEIIREKNLRLQEQVRELEIKLRKELDRSFAKHLLVYPARKIVAFGRRHRSLIAPKNSLREQFARSILQAFRSGGSRENPGPIS